MGYQDVKHRRRQPFLCGRLSRITGLHVLPSSCSSVCPGSRRFVCLPRLCSLEFDDSYHSTGAGAGRSGLLLATWPVEKS